jgi:purine-binding chemotaxis protein CheW
MNPEANPTSPTPREARSQLLTFELGNEEYAVDILRVQEIRGWTEATPIPNTPSWIKGIINLRGAIVPIVDLRERFEMDHQSYGPTTVVIVLRAVHAERERIVGIVVDAVSDVCTLDATEIQTPPDFGAAIDTCFVRGLASIAERMLIVLEIDQLLDFTTLAEISKRTS